MMENPATEVKTGRENAAPVSNVGVAEGGTTPVPWAETETVETKKRATMKMVIEKLTEAIVIEIKRLRMK